MPDRIVHSLENLATSLISDLQDAVHYWHLAIFGLLLLYVAMLILGRHLKDLLHVALNEMSHAFSAQITPLSANFWMTLMLILLFLITGDDFSRLVIDKLQGQSGSSDLQSSYVSLASIFVIGLFFIASLAFGTLHDRD